ncbi:hypothetical protein BD779DRAFT_745005 [Infundibulicybe gibba]|nr:hypothetical protein BD779DRAFT_745005 [Infundibulicybe gibba]
MSIPKDHTREGSSALVVDPPAISFPYLPLDRGIYNEAPPPVWLPQAGQVDPALASTPHSPSPLAADEEGPAWMGKRRACRFCNKDQAAAVVGRHEGSCEENENRILGKYVCGTCDARFNRVDSRTRHRKTARKKGSCPKPKARSTHFTPPSSTQPYPASNLAQPSGGSDRDSPLTTPVGNHHVPPHQDGPSPDWLNYWDQALPYYPSTRRTASNTPYPATHKAMDGYQPQSPALPQTFSSSPASQNPTAQPSAGNSPSTTPEAFKNAPSSRDWTQSYPETQYCNRTHQLSPMMPSNSNDCGVPSAPIQPPSVAMSSSGPGELTTPQPDQVYTALFGTSRNVDTITGEDWTPISDGSISEQGFEGGFQHGIVDSNNPNHLTTSIQQGIDYFGAHCESIIAGEEMALTSDESRAGWGFQDQFPGTLNHSFSSIGCQRQDQHYHPYESYHP